MILRFVVVLLLHSSANQQNKVQTNAFCCRFLGGYFLVKGFFGVSPRDFFGS